MDLYQRNINVSVHRVDDDRIMLWSTMLDLDHSIRVQLVVDSASRQIVDACGEMLIDRAGFYVRRNRIKEGKCPECDVAIPGVWE